MSLSQDDNRKRSHGYYLPLLETSTAVLLTEARSGVLRHWGKAGRVHE